MLRLKDDSVSLLGVSPQIVFALQVADGAMREVGADCIVTSVSEPWARHSRTSLHYTGDAVDIRTKHLPGSEVKRQVEQRIATALGIDFDVILEDLGGRNEHIHIEWQPKRRERA